MMDILSEIHVGRTFSLMARTITNANKWLQWSRSHTREWPFLRAILNGGSSPQFPHQFELMG